MLKMRPLTAVQAINYGVPNKFEAFKVDFMHHNLNLNFVNHKMPCNSSDKSLTLFLRLSLLKNDIKEFLDILKILQCDLQHIFELILNIPLVTI